MIDLTQEQLVEIYQRLPAPLQDAIWNKENTDALIKISESNYIEEKESALAELTGRVFLGTLPIKKFRNTIQEELKIPEDQARAIAEEIREKIFAPVADDLRKLHGLDAN